MKARFYFDVKFPKRATDAESLASALDNVMDAGMSALDDCWDEYGGKPQVGKVFVLDTEGALDWANEMDKFADGQDDDMGKFCRSVRDFLRRMGKPSDPGKRAALTVPK